MSREEERAEWDRLDKEWDQLSKEQQAERLTQLHRQKRAHDKASPAAEMTGGLPSTWYHPERYSPHDLLRVEFFELIQEIVPQALEKLRDDVLPSYEKLFEAGFLNVSDWGGALSFRGSDKEDVERLMSEPASLIWQLRRIQGADYDGLVNDFRAAFEVWCWDHGLLDLWSWNVPMHTLFVWTAYAHPSSDGELKWAPALLRSGPPISLPISLTWTWYPELIPRETFLAKVFGAVEERLVEAEEQMDSNLGFVRRTSPQRPGDRAGDEDIFQRDLRWLVRFQVAGEAEVEMGDPNTVPEALEAKAEELGLRKRTDVQRKEWSLVEALRDSPSNETLELPDERQMPVEGGEGEEKRPRGKLEALEPWTVNEELSPPQDEKRDQEIGPSHRWERHWTQQQRSSEEPEGK